MSISPKSEHSGSSFGKPTPEPSPEDGLLGPAVKLNAVNAARPRHRAEPAAPAPQPATPAQPAPALARVSAPTFTDLVPEHMRVPAGHPPISDMFGGFNRYVGGNSISLNQYGGLDVGRGGPDGAVHTGQQVHIHTMMFLRGV